MSQQIYSGFIYLNINTRLGLFTDNEETPSTYYDFFFFLKKLGEIEDK